jgi:circadian clock protein KaiB
MFVLRLYVGGASPKSLEALKNLKNICDGHLAGHYKLDVVDIYQQPERASRDQIVAVPMLVKELPLPVRRLIGTLSNTTQVLTAFGVINAALTVTDRRQRGARDA